MKYGRFLLLVAVALAVAGISRAARGTGATAANFLKIPLGAKPLSLGETYVSLCEDANAVFWNPAGVAMSARELTASYTRLPGDINAGNIGMVLPMGKKGNLGIGAIFLHSGSIEHRGQTRDLLGTFSMQDIAVSAGWGYKIQPQLSVGANLKLIREGFSFPGTVDFGAGAVSAADNVLSVALGTWTAYGVAMDIGALYIHDFPNGIRLAAGGAFFNLGPPMGPGRPSKMPMEARLGVSIKTPNDKITFATEADVPLHSDIRAGVGAEYKYGLVRFRVGYRFNQPDLGSLGGLSGGMGIEYNYTSAHAKRQQLFRLDYAFGSMGALGVGHRISFSIGF